MLRPVDLRRSRLSWRRSGVVALALLVVAALVVLGVRLRGHEREDPGDRLPVRTWASGAWTGGFASAERIEAFGRWRGAPADTVVTYPEATTWESMRRSDWHVSTFDGFDGRLVYGLPLLPKEQSGSLADVAAGRHDDVWRAVADSLTRNGRGDSYVRIGLEANGTWAPWGATAATAEDWKRAYRRVADILRERAPRAVLVFDIGCGVGLDGSADRTAALTALYPGDDVVDVVGCDAYDSFDARATDDEQFARVLRPDDAPGMLDVVEFARSRGKRFAVPEWGLTATDAGGSGDNPYYVFAMYRFFAAHARDLAFENYFNEADTDLDSAIWDRDLNPRASRTYLRLW